MNDPLQEEIVSGDNRGARDLSGPSHHGTWFAVDADGMVAAFNVRPRGDLPHWWKPTSVNDFPAAHSGDVEWFATDAAGHVAYFNPWHSAPVPLAADATKIWQTCVKPGWDISTVGELVSRLAKPCFKSSGEMIDLEGALSLIHGFKGRDFVGANRISKPIGKAIEQRVQDTRREKLGQAFVIIEKLDCVRQSLDSGLATLEPQRPSPPPYVVKFSALSRSVARDILQSGDCIACVKDIGTTDFEEQNLLPGVFHYGDCDPEEGFCGPYFRGTAPVEPLTIDRLPEPLRAFISQVTFSNLSFMESPLLQPLEHLPCKCHWSEYVDIDGRTIRNPPGVVTDLTSHQAHWNKKVAEIESRRHEQRQAMVTDWPIE